MGWKNFFSRAFAIVLSLLIAFPPVIIAQTEDPLPRLVLMPVNGENLSKSKLSAYRKAIADGLEGKYKIITGRVVDKTIREVSTKGIVCDTLECLQNVALEITNVELVATTTVTTEPGRLLILLKITNVFDETNIYSRSEICEGCSKKQVIELLKAMASGKTRSVFKQPGGTVTVWSEPFIPNTVIYVDGKEKGKVPAILQLPAGEHEIEVKTGDNQKSGKKKVTVPSGESFTVTISMLPTPEAIRAEKKKSNKGNWW